jgi:uncharacterized membrane protein
MPDRGIEGQPRDSAKKKEEKMLGKKFGRTLRRYFITGIVVIVPIWVTVLLIRWVINLINKTFNFLPLVLQPKTYFQFFGIGLIIALLLIMLVGALGSNYLGKRLLRLGENLLVKIPFVKTVYQGVKYLTTGVIGDKKIFSRVVLLEFPIKGLSSIGFVTGEAGDLVPKSRGKKMLKVFVPTTPNPTTGFFCIAAEDEVQSLDISVEEAFKLIISAGFADVRTPEKGLL